MTNDMGEAGGEAVGEAGGEAGGEVYRFPIFGFSIGLVSCCAGVFQFSSEKSCYYCLT